ncbi:hypothetical protein D3C87_1666410 [compost metagenome]
MLNLVGCDWLEQIVVCAIAQPACAVVSVRDDLDRDVTRGEISLQLLEQQPAIDVRQARVQCDCGGIEALDQLQRIRATGRDDRPESLLMRGLEQDAGESGVALEHQQHLVAGLDRLAVVEYLCSRT